MPGAKRPTKAETDRRSLLRPISFADQMDLRRTERSVLSDMQFYAPTEQDFAAMGPAPTGGQ